MSFSIEIEISDLQQYIDKLYFNLIIFFNYNRDHENDKYLLYY
jgi:hypothetical protein